jgi:steroid delta-isomerase-like uncharacterized protein
MTVEENKNLARQFFDAMNTGDETVWDRLCIPEYVLHENAQDWTLAQLKQYMKALPVAFPDQVFSVKDVFAEGDKVAVRYTWQGTHKGSYRGLAPTGKKVALVFLQIHRISNGKCAETWEVVDLSQFYAQLGITSKPAATTEK